MEIIQDVILTDSFLILGNITTKYRRLSQVLDNYSKLFIPMVDVTMYDNNDGETIHVSDLLVNLNEVILAHEFVDSGGDNYQKSLSVDGEKVEIRAFYNGRVNLELRGLVRRSAYERNRFNKTFFVMEGPKMKGLPQNVAKTHKVLRKLPYIIVNKAKMSYIFDSAGCLPVQTC